MGIRRLLSSIISFSLVIFPSILSGNQLATAQYPDDKCGEEKCSADGPAVRFPFVLRGKQPEYCGYNSSFNLQCDQANRTIFELPSSSVKLEVSSISYSSQRMVVQSLETCLAKHLRDLDIYNTTPFHYYTVTPPYGQVTQVDQFSLFNCTSAEAVLSWRWRINCLRSEGYEVLADAKSMGIWSLRDGLESCTKMYDTKLIPWEIFYSDFMTLNWSLPLCKSCEVRGRICRWKNGTNSQLGCYKHHYGILKALRISGPIIGCMLLAPAIGAIIFIYSKLEEHKENQLTIRKFLDGHAAMKLMRYSYAEIKKITNNFNHKLGEGGYGNVFKGRVSNEIFVAVKLLHNSTENGEEFINEVGTMGTIHHINVVRLLGFCADGYKRALVYEFLPNGSLDKFIFQKDQEHHTLGMDRMQDIAVGIARGIEYLHQGCQQRILHFDIKPHNILLDDKYNPKISDFGLAKLCKEGKSVVSMTAARGTMGYIAPEVFSRHFGNVSYKSDVYSFGMLLLEMVGQRKNTDATVQNVSQVYFPEWVYDRLANGEEFRIQVEENGDDRIAKKLAIVGLWCIQWNPINRPSIAFALQMLEGNGENLTLPSNPFTSGNAMNQAGVNEHTRSLGTTLAVISESE